MPNVIPRARRPQPDYPVSAPSFGEGATSGVTVQPRYAEQAEPPPAAPQPQLARPVLQPRSATSPNAPAMPASVAQNAPGLVPLPRSIQEDPMGNDRAPVMDASQDQYNDSSEDADVAGTASGASGFMEESAAGRLERLREERQRIYEKHPTDQDGRLKSGILGMLNQAGQTARARLARGGALGWEDFYAAVGSGIGGGVGGAIKPDWNERAVRDYQLGQVDQQIGQEAAIEKAQSDAEYRAAQAGLSRERTKALPQQVTNQTRNATARETSVALSQRRVDNADRPKVQTKVVGGKLVTTIIDPVKGTAVSEWATDKDGKPIDGTKVDYKPLEKKANKQQAIAKALEGIPDDINPNDSELFRQMVSQARLQGEKNGLKGQDLDAYAQSEAWGMIIDSPNSATISQVFPDPTKQASVQRAIAAAQGDSQSSVDEYNRTLHRIAKHEQDTGTSGKRQVTDYQLEKMISDYKQRMAAAKGNGAEQSRIDQYFSDALSKIYVR